MLALIKAVFFLTTHTGNPVQIPTSICSNDLSHLNYKNQVDISIGCSKVNGRRYYSKRRLEGLYGE